MSQSQGEFPEFAEVLKNLLGEQEFEVFLEKLNEPFVPTTFFVERLDILLYIREDCAYRSQWVDETLEILLHPHEERVVGFKLTGFSDIVQKHLAELSGLPAA